MTNYSEKLTLWIKFRVKVVYTLQQCVCLRRVNIHLYLSQIRALLYTCPAISCFLHRELTSICKQWMKTWMYVLAEWNNYVRLGKGTKITFVFRQMKNSWSFQPYEEKTVLLRKYSRFETGQSFYPTRRLAIKALFGNIWHCIAVRQSRAA